MAEEVSRVTRLSAITTQLQSKRMLTAKEIADKYQISIRTVYRDIQTLKQAGIPIITEEGKGYSIAEGYRVPPVMFTEQETMALITAGKLIKKNKDQSLIDNYENALLKIMSILRLNQKDKTELIASRLEVRNNPKGEKTSNYLVQIQSTIANTEVIKIDYVALDGKATQRKVEPFALYTTQGNWLLIAFCQKRNDFRAFRLDCIQELRLTGEYFEAQKMTLEEFLAECRKKYQIP